ncbi:Cytochrome P450, E-class, group IV [Heracleum sosnowskyi]|uniref:Cytochrome P450, E-class, group IV n=1 Tax=Heracleum sosnowskyi TaxID=360622 RepID=A0AAD8H258_9APIA|nr:Cytochrome P450, E-class, group IV [Heracleum sosnowskyi]
MSIITILSDLLIFLPSWLMMIISFSLYIYFTKRNSINIPGPKSYPIIGSLISFYQNRHRLIQWYTHLLSISPTQTIMVRRLGAPPTIITANPSNVEYILKNNFNNYPKGKPFTEILGDFLGSGIFNVDGELWNSQRKLASHEFSTKSLNKFVVQVLEQEVEQRLVPLLVRACENDIVLDLQEVFKCFAFDTICKVALGIDRCSLDISHPPSPTFAGLAEAFYTAAEISALRGAAPVSAVWKAKRALGLGSEKKLREAVESIHVTIYSIIRAKRLENEKGGEGENGDLLSRLILAGNDDEMVRDMVISFVMAGHETTSSGMTWLIWLLSENDDVEKKLLHEMMLLEKEAEGLSFEVLKEMNYMKACLCESMRLYPPVAWDSKHAAANDILPDGTVVFKGNRVTYSAYGMGRMVELWGKDSLEFKPDRWFDEPGVLKMVSPYKFPVFHAGPRVCLGKEMALIQMKYVVASVLRRFKFRPVGLEKPVYVPLLTACMGGGLKVRVRKRSVT